MPVNLPSTRMNKKEIKGRIVILKSVLNYYQNEVKNSFACGLCAAFKWSVNVSVEEYPEVMKHKPTDKEMLKNNCFPWWFPDNVGNDKRIEILKLAIAENEALLK